VQSILFLGAQCKLQQWKTMISKFLPSVYTHLAHWNIFSRTDFASVTDRTRAQRLGQWATLLYVLLFALGSVLVILSRMAQSRTLTRTFDQPTLKLTQELFHRYGNDLQCPCSSIASTYSHFVQREARFHQVRVTDNDLIALLPFFT
jgi:hypothetical protein